MPRGSDPYETALIQGRLWTPALERVQVRAWYDASDFSTLSGGTTGIATWRDRGAYGNHLTAPSSAREPTFNVSGFGGRPTLVWNGQVLASNGSALTRLSSVTGFATSDIISVHGAAQHYTGPPNTNSVAIIQFNLSTGTAEDWTMSTILGTQLDRDGTNNAISTYHDNSGILSAAAITINTPFIFSQKMTTAACQNGVNGTLATVSGFVPSYPTGGTVGKIAVGTMVTDANIRAWWGSISEVIVWAGAIADYQRQRLEGYLAWKWGLNDRLAGVHPYKNRPPMVGD